MTNPSTNDATVAELTARLARLEGRLAARPRRLPWTRITSLVLGLAGLIGVAQTVFAADPAPPSAIPYRGTITENGAPLHAPAGVPMVFTLYDSQAGTTQVGSPYGATVPVVDGVFSVQIPVSAVTLRRAEVWLAMTVNGNALSGRQRLLTVPYAARATEALMATANGVPAGALMMFTTECPEGWQEYVAARGRFFVGANTGWGLAAPRGAAMVDPAMGHTHTAGHAHTVPNTAGAVVNTVIWRDAATTQNVWSYCGSTWGGCPGGTGDVYFSIGNWVNPDIAAAHYHAVGNTGTATPTTSASKTEDLAPYLTVRVCQKL